MPRRGKRRRLARGIYEDKTGRAAVYAGKEKRFPPFTPLSDLRAWRDDQRKSRKGSSVADSRRGTLASAINELATIERKLPCWTERRSELRAWEKAGLAARRFPSGLTDKDVRRTIAAWLAAGVAPKTIRQRVWTLKHLYHVLRGKRQATPCDDIPLPKPPRRVINPTAAETILAVYKALLHAQCEGCLKGIAPSRDRRLPLSLELYRTRARFMVRAATGRRPSEIMRAAREDVDLERGIWRVRDGKGGWSEGIYLDDDAVIAWQTVIDSNAWGPYDTSREAAILRAAGWPETSRPYNLRHSVGIALSEAGHDLDDVAAWLGQKDSRTTRASYVPVLKSRMQRMGESLSGRLSGWNVARDRGTPSDSTS